MIGTLPKNHKASRKKEPMKETFPSSRHGARIERLPSQGCLLNLQFQLRLGLSRTVSSRFAGPFVPKKAMPKAWEMMVAGSTWKLCRNVRPSLILAAKDKQNQTLHCCEQYLFIKPPALVAYHKCKACGRGGVKTNVKCFHGFLCEAGTGELRTDCSVHQCHCVRHKTGMGGFVTMQPHYILVHCEDRAPLS